MHGSLYNSEGSLLSQTTANLHPWEKPGGGKQTNRKRKGKGPKKSVCIVFQAFSMNVVKTVNTLPLQSVVQEESPVKKMRIESAAEARNDQDDLGGTTFTALYLSLYSSLYLCVCVWGGGGGG